MLLATTGFTWKNEEEILRALTRVKPKKVVGYSTPSKWSDRNTTLTLFQLFIAFQLLFLFFYYVLLSVKAIFFQLELVTFFSLLFELIEIEICVIFVYVFILFYFVNVLRVKR